LRTLNIAYKISGLRESTQTITTAIERSSKIVMALKNYAHYNHSADKVLTDITEGIETVLTLYHHQLKHGIEIERNYDTSAPVWCYADELAQVWTNLIHNAMHAMDKKGTLQVSVFPRMDDLVVQFTDSGCGIPANLRQRIFEPFFTTKPAGEGSGLGLDIVKKIIDKHQGTIDVESRPGKTTFTICLPRAQEDVQNKAVGA
jgi:signal transduction histidine kinase